MTRLEPARGSCAEQQEERETEGEAAVSKEREAETTISKEREAQRVATTDHANGHALCQPSRQ